MYTADDYKARLAGAAQAAITDTPDGRPWYHGRSICRALCLDTATSFAKIRPEFKHMHPEELGRYRKTRRLYISRAGVETLVMIKGNLPRAEMMAALDRASAIDTTEPRAGPADCAPAL